MPESKLSEMSNFALLSATLKDVVKGLAEAGVQVHNARMYLDELASRVAEKENG